MILTAFLSLSKTKTSVFEHIILLIRNMCNAFVGFTLQKSPAYKRKEIEDFGSFCFNTNIDRWWNVVPSNYVSSRITPVDVIEQLILNINSSIGKTCPQVEALVVRIKLVADYLFLIHIAYLIGFRINRKWFEIWDRKQQKWINIINNNPWLNNVYQ